uniref:Putative transcription factor n=1 Tax=Ogataea minuta TaxID=36026 RepID=A0A348AZ72_9ASCO|nr:putative transcription factor [Ogataea minuta]
MKTNKCLMQRYNENEDNPYLTRTDLDEIVKQTGLSSSQVKNWVSNKRRKEKTVFVSEELCQLLY